MKDTFSFDSLDSWNIVNGDCDLLNQTFQKETCGKAMRRVLVTVNYERILNQEYGCLCMFPGSEQFLSLKSQTSQQVAIIFRYNYGKESYFRENEFVFKRFFFTNHRNIEALETYLLQSVMSCLKIIPLSVFLWEK